MPKFILFFVLFILFISFGAFFFNVYNLQSNYFKNKNKVNPTPQEIVALDIEIPSLYTNYSKLEYDKALLTKRVVVLFFTANWCNLCIDQDIVNKEVLDSLTKEGVVGLKIHILDSQTTTESDLLAKKFDVTKENSYVLLDKNGAVGFKHTGNITNDLLRTKILEVVNK